MLHEVLPNCEQYVLPLTCDEAGWQRLLHFTDRIDHVSRMRLGQDRLAQDSIYDRKS